ncbi:MAG: YigZ family protein [Bacteroidota bacterium]
MDKYRTISKPSEPVVYKNRKSKFYGFAFPISDVTEVPPILNTLHQRYDKANHVCYAWKLGVDRIEYRTNDDGEPNNSAGKPIYGQIQAFELTNVLVAVVRYFGGTKLGMGGLISAYRTVAEMALSQADRIEKYVEHYFDIQFEYQLMSAVMRVIRKWNITIHAQAMEENCAMKLSLRKSKSTGALKELQDIYGLQIKMN